MSKQKKHHTKLQTRRRIHKIGDKRLLCRFLFLPRCINGHWRWLEYAIWEEECWREGDNHYNASFFGVRWIR